MLLLTRVMRGRRGDGVGWVGAVFECSVWLETSVRHFGQYLLSSAIYFHIVLAASPLGGHF